MTCFGLLPRASNINCTFCCPVTNVTSSQVLGPNVLADHSFNPQRSRGSTATATALAAHSTAITSCRFGCPTVSPAQLARLTARCMHASC